MDTTLHIPIVENSSLNKVLESRSEILFAYLFGSFSTGKETSLSDIDMAMFFEHEISLLELGQLTAELESCTKRDVDIIVLNDLYKKDPALAFDIVAHGTLVVAKDDTALQKFKTKTIMYYFDTAHLRKQVEAAFRLRLNSGRFARQTYA